MLRTSCLLNDNVRFMKQNIYTGIMHTVTFGCAIQGIKCFYAINNFIKKVFFYFFFLFIAEAIAIPENWKVRRSTILDRKPFYF